MNLKKLMVSISVLVRLSKTIMLYHTEYFIDIDECVSSSCENCTNTDGGFLCSCKYGYSLINGSFCIIDEPNSSSVRAVEYPGGKTVYITVSALLG